VLQPCQVNAFPACTLYRESFYACALSRLSQRRCCVSFVSVLPVSVRAVTSVVASLQAQRDYFGAHTYERTDREGAYHTEWFKIAKKA